MFELQQDIDKDYEVLLDYIAKTCDRFSFIKSRALMADEEVAMKYLYETIDEILPFLIEMKEQSEWETNALVEHTAYVFYFHVNAQTIEFLKKKSKSLFGWISPYLPEDLAFYKGDELWLACNSHSGYFICSEKVDTYEEFLEIITAS